MNFKEKIEQQIKAAEHGSVEKNILKVLLSDIQKEQSRPVNANKDVPDEWCVKLARKFHKDNVETIGYLRKAGAAAEVEKLEEENLVLESLITADKILYWSKQDIKNWISDMKINIKASPSASHAVASCMARLKGMDVRGQDVKEVIAEIFEN